LLKNLFIVPTQIRWKIFLIDPWGPKKLKEASPEQLYRLSRDPFAFLFSVSIAESGCQVC